MTVHADAGASRREDPSARILTRGQVSGLRLPDGSAFPHANFGRPSLYKVEIYSLVNSTGGPSPRKSGAFWGISHSPRKEWPFRGMLGGTRAGGRKSRVGSRCGLPRTSGLRAAGGDRAPGPPSSGTGTWQSSRAVCTAACLARFRGLRLRLAKANAERGTSVVGLSRFLGLIDTILCHARFCRSSDRLNTESVRPLLTRGCDNQPDKR
jgi:hypothetical protein